MIEGSTDSQRSPQRELIECRIEHADLDAMIDQMESMPSPSRDELALRRLKKRRLALRDRMVRLQQWLDPLEPA